MQHSTASISEDFPLYHSKYIPINKKQIHSIGKRITPSNVYTNEHPDFFKLDCMKERGYNNPFIDKLIAIDRNEELKKINSNSNQICLIDYLKTNRKFSQDTKLLKYIRSEFDIQMFKKRQKLKKQDNNFSNTEIRHTFKLDNKNENYNRLLTELDYFGPRINYKMKNTMDTTQNISFGKFNISKENYEKIKEIGCEFDPSKSAYLSNMNDYQISEAQNRNKNKEFNLNRKKILRHGLINGKNEICQLPPKRVDKWGSFYENYLMLLRNNNFKKKGGLFTEFSNKNIEVINVNKREIRKKIESEKQTKNARKIIRQKMGQ